LIAPKKFQTLLRGLAPLKYLIPIQAFRNPLSGELPHFQIVMDDKIQLAQGRGGAKDLSVLPQ